MGGKKILSFLKRVFIDFVRTRGWNSPRGLALTRAHNLLMNDNEVAVIPCELMNESYELS
jgi:hypothetical protein